MIQKKIKNLIIEALNELGIEAEDIHLEHPADFSLGDYSTNVAMVEAKKVGKNPREYAEEIVSKLSEKKDEDVERVEVAGPGFINFYLSRAFFQTSIQKVLDEKDDWGKNDVFSGKKIIADYTNPNPFKKMHIGHLVPNATGESILRVLSFSGAEVKRANYQGDVGLHVAKAVWHFINAARDINSEKDLNELALGIDYSAGNSAYEESEADRAEIEEVNKEIYDGNDTEVNEVYKRGRARSLELFEKIYALLGTKYDYYFFESETGHIGKEIVEEHPEVFEESDGAVIFRGEKYGLHTRVFITKNGLPTYEAKDLGLLKLKADVFPYDQSITVTGNEQKEYFHVVKKAAEEVLPELGPKLRVITNGMLRLPSGKMSSRTGEVVSVNSLLDAVRERLAPKLADTRVENPKALEDVIAVGAIKYSILKHGTGHDIIFDFDKSLSFEGDSGPYIQYTHARARSVIARAEGLGVKPQIGTVVDDTVTGVILKLLYRFPEIVLRAAKEYEPHYITTYLTELAGAFNAFYAKERIADAEHDASYRASVTIAVAVTLKNGLHLLGIEMPERM